MRIAKRLSSMRVGLVGGLLTALLVLTGCGPTYLDLPLPGEASDSGLQLHAVFANALNLAQGAPVKVNGVTVGHVQKIQIHNYQAAVDMVLAQGTTIPSGTTARLRYDTPLGEVFVQLDPATGRPALSSGATIPIADTTTAATVEDTLANVSLLINGGSLSSIGTITNELNAAFNGRQSTFRRSITDLNTFLSGVNASRQQIDDLLQTVVGASTVLGRRNASIDRALHSLAPAAQVLHQDTPELVKLLASTTTTSAQINALLTRTRSNFLMVIDQLSPILDQVLAMKPWYPQLLQELLTARSTIESTIRGDYYPTNIALSLDMSSLLGGLFGPRTGSGNPQTGTNNSPQTPGSSGLGIPGLPGLPGLGGARTGASSNPLGGLLGGLL